MFSNRSLWFGFAALALIGFAASAGLAAKADKNAAGTTGVIVAIDKKADKTGTITIRTTGGKKNNVAGPEKKFTFDKDTKIERAKNGKNPRAADLSDLQKDLTVHIQANGEAATVIQVEESRKK